MPDPLIVAQPPPAEVPAQVAMALARSLAEMLNAFAPGDGQAQRIVHEAREALRLTTDRWDVIPLPTTVVQRVSQTGAVLGEAQPGATLVLHSRAWSPTPHCAELQADADDDGAEIGLEWEGQTLTGYDGVFELPVEVAEALEARGARLLPEVDPRHVDTPEQDRADGRTPQDVDPDWIVYYDGRHGHEGVRAEVLEISDGGMVAQFWDRPSPNDIRWHDQGWMRNLRPECPRCGNLADWTDGPKDSRRFVRCGCST